MSNPESFTRRKTTSGWRARAIRVLVIEDEQASREFVASELEHAGYLVGEAADGQEGLEQVRRFAPDVIVLDLMLPVLSGFAVARAVRALDRHRNCAILAVTALASEVLRIEALSAGCDVLLRKPVPAALVAEQVCRLVTRRGLKLPSGGSP